MCVGCRRRWCGSAMSCSFEDCPIPIARLQVTGSRPLVSQGNEARHDQHLIDQISQELMCARDGEMEMGGYILHECESIREVPIVKVTMAEMVREEGGGCWGPRRRKCFDYYLVGTRKTVFVEGYPGERCGGECGCGDFFSNWNVV